MIDRQIDRYIDSYEKNPFFFNTMIKVFVKN